MTFLTDAADQAVLLPLMLAIAAILAARRWWRGLIAWVSCTLCVSALMLVLKLVFTVCGASLGFSHIRSPSGHTAAAAVVYGGLLALGAGRLMAGLISAGLGLVIGITRVTLGMHTVEEVIIGGLVGVAGAVALEYLAGTRPPRLRGWPLAAVTLAVLIAFHGLHLHAEPVIHRAALLLIWPRSAC
ncbi:MAG: phosphatase PAP2 family protein, partial [Acetobacteraceae bacterium]|nr:phosphatase PAP2 family protein [Acetobacteraceae bacterium]